MSHAPADALLAAVRTYVVGIRNPAERGKEFDRVHQQRFGAILAAFDAMEAEPLPKVVGAETVSMKADDLRRAIRLLMSDDGFDDALRILMPVVGMRRAIWDLDAAPSVPVDQFFGTPAKEATDAR